MIVEVCKKQKRKRWPGHNPDSYFYFRIVAANGEIIAQSEQYTQKHNAMSIVRKYFSPLDWEVKDLT
jgi:hypothetical protein